MKKQSAGILMYRFNDSGFDVLLVHPGGPFFKNRDDGVWSIPKGEIEDGEENDLLAVARRELQEETGCEAEGDFIHLGDITQKGGKIVHAWAVEGACDTRSAVSNTFSMEWPPGSGQLSEFPEVDRVEWFDPDMARQKVKGRQVPLIDRLEEYIKTGKITDLQSE